MCRYIIQYNCTDNIERSDMLKGSKKENGKVKHLDIRLTKNEYEEIAKKASKKNMKKSEYILYLVKKDK